MLEKQLSWDEIAEKIANQITANNIALNKPKFIEWFKQREKIGLRFDWQLIFRCYTICQTLNNNDDHFTVLVSREGQGKSTLGMQLASWTSPETFSLKYTCYNSHDYLTLLKKVAEEKETSNTEEKKTLFLDEAALDLFSREAMTLNNRWLSKAFFTQRFLNCHVILAIPNFFMLDSIVREHRVRTLISILSKGHYKGITGAGINVINQNGTKYHKQINSIPIPDGHFWTGNFNKPFPNNIDQAEYDKHKLSNIKSFLDTAQEESLGIKMISATKVAKEIGVASDTIVNGIKKGAYEGKKIGDKWFITKQQYDKLMTV